MKAIEETVETNISSPFEIKKKRFFNIKSPSKIFMETGIDFFKKEALDGL